MPADKPPQSHPQARKPIFDAMRAILKRGFRQAEVDALDNVLDSALGNGSEFSPQYSVASVSTGASEPRQVSQAGVALIKRFEGCARLRRDGLVEAYPDPGTGGDPWTIGWGATRGGLYGFVDAGTVWTQPQCDERLVDDLTRYAAEVARAIGDAPTSQAQFDAMVAFHYNTGAISRATLTKKHVAGDIEGAAGEFARWNKAGGRVLKGLVRRRAEEERLYRS